VTADEIKKALFFTVDAQDLYKTMDEIGRCERKHKTKLTNPERREIKLFAQDNEKALFNKVLH